MRDVMPSLTSFYPMKNVLTYLQIQKNESNMKTLLFALLLTCLPPFCFAQNQVDAIVMPSATGEGTAGTTSVQYVIGEISGLLEKPNQGLAVGSLHCFSCAGKPTSIDQVPGLTADQLKLYPNPTDAKVQIETTVEYELEYMVWGLDGRFYRAGKFRQQTAVDLSELASGLYLFILYDPQGKQVYQTKVTKY